MAHVRVDGGADFGGMVLGYCIVAIVTGVSWFTVGLWVGVHWR